jgi:hypothetical protein
MDSLSHLFNEFVAPSYEPTAEDWADYNEYLDSVGYDNGDDDWDEDPDADRGFQPFEESPF